ncbi:MAG: hypothetical protein Q4B70_19555 [Lachnospiraceae bacterium]|nr:hypothetical protein [Lachnospiraceae bacterium]
MFEQKYGHYMQEMTSYVEAAGDKEKASEEIGEIVTKEVQMTFARKNGKLQSGVQGDMNLFMIYYVFPAILKTEHADAKQVCDGICKKWAEVFKGNNISYTDYDKIYASFREKIFGIF